MKTTYSSPIDSIRRMFDSIFCKYLTAFVIGHPVSQMDGNLTRPDSDLVYWITIDIFCALTIALNSKCCNNWESSCVPWVVFPLFTLHARTHTSNIFLAFRFFVIMSGSFKETKNKNNNNKSKKYCVHRVSDKVYLT